MSGCAMPEIKIWINNLKHDALQKGLSHIELWFLFAQAANEESISVMAEVELHKTLNSHG